MTIEKMNNLLAKQAEEISMLADIMGVELPFRFIFIIESAKKYGTSIIDPIALRMTFRLVLMHKFYGFIFGYISEDEMTNELNWFENFSRKFGNGGEYEPYSRFDYKSRNMAIRYTRLLPQH